MKNLIQQPKLWLSSFS